MMKLESNVGHTFEAFQRVVEQLLKPQGIPPDSMLNSYFRARKYLGSKDRKFIAENVYNALRYYHWSTAMVENAIRSFNEEIFDEDKQFLTLLMTMSGGSIQPSQVLSLCEKFLKSAQLRQFIPKILHRFEHPTTPEWKDRNEELALRYSFPLWMIERFVRRFGEEETERLCAALNEPAPITIRVNTLLTTVDACQARLKSEGIDSVRTRFSPVGLTLSKRMNAFSLQTFRDGWFEVQDEGSQLITLFIDPKPTDRILDACAGSGGKTLAFAALMKNRGEIVAADVNEVRLQELRKRARRAGVHNVRVQPVTTLDELSPRFHDTFDVVFVDAPCSGLGTLRRNPGFKISVTETTVDAVSAKQRQILDSVAPLVKINGMLVYTTCSVLMEENENQIESFLKRNPLFTPIIPQSTLASNLDLFSKQLPWCTLLPHLHRTDGFFCAFLRRLR
ncbi:MAG TPA: methyltransferase domain-containing protein [Bacteroidota bacterium]|nr:methyltransferase domain-containing protein [Bacteroidota bacterium]